MFRHRKKIDRSPVLQKHIFERLKEGWSPQQIAGRDKLDLGKVWVSHETIYKYIYSPNGIKDGLYKYLRSKRKKRYPKIGRKPNRRTLIPNRVSIHDRPETITNRLDFGHWEADLIVFSQDKRANLLTLRERKSRFMIAIKNMNRSPDTIVSNLFEKYRLHWRPPFNSITFDNDISFIQHERIAKEFESKTYFCDAYKSYQKGTIENGNRLLREYFPRNVDILAIQQKDIDRYVELVNNRPMKCLGYKTPDEIYRECTYPLLR